MDNLTHSLVGWALAETGLKRRTRKGLAACVLAANMPDIDVFFGWAPWAPLAMHRGFTHGLIGGVLLMPPLLAGLLWWLDRWQGSRGRDFAGAPPMHLGWLIALSYLGAITHPLLDLQNTYAIQLLSPLSGRWFHTDGLFIVSPWVLAMLGAGIWLSRKRASAGRRPAGLPALLALGGVCAFIGLNIAISAAAHEGPREMLGVRPDRVFASPGPVLFWQRDIVWRGEGRVGRGRYDPLDTTAPFSDFSAPEWDGMDDPAARQAAASSAQAVKFLAWSQVPFARVVRQGCTARVTFGDARYARQRTLGGFTVEATIREGCSRR